MKGLVLAGMIAAGFASATAYAGTQSFSIDYTTRSGATGDVLITTTGAAGGPFTVAHITGTEDGNAITGLANFAGDDQLLYAADPFFDAGGLSFAIGSVDYNLYYWGGEYLEVTSVEDRGRVFYGDGSQLTSLTVTAVDEPAGFAVLGVALVGLTVVTGKRLTGARAW